jgi:cellulose biosynthesis protein BcsQ
MDLDPQSSLTTFMGLEPLEIEKTLYDALLEDEPLPIQKDIHGVDLAPANINLSGAELELVTADMREQRMKDAIAPIQEQYDFILIDCPPSLGILSYISLVASTHVLIRFKPSTKHFKELTFYFVPSSVFAPAPIVNSKSRVICQRCLPKPTLKTSASCKRFKSSLLKLKG